MGRRGDFIYIQRREARLKVPPAKVHVKRSQLNHTHTHTHRFLPSPLKVRSRAKRGKLQVHFPKPLSRFFGLPWVQLGQVPEPKQKLSGQSSQTRCLRRVILRIVLRVCFTRCPPPPAIRTRPGEPESPRSVKFHNGRAPALLPRF